MAAARTAIKLMKDAHAEGQLRIADNEANWLDMMIDTLDDLPEDEGTFIAEQVAMADAAKFLPAEYGL